MEGLKVILVYVTCANLNEANEIVKESVNQKLAACANVLGESTSFYMWKNSMKSDSEVVVLLKTMEDKFYDLKKLIKTIHSYECPCILGLPVIKGNRDYLKWVYEEV